MTDDTGSILSERVWNGIDDPVLMADETALIPEPVRRKIQAAWDAVRVQGEAFAAEVRRLDDECEALRAALAAAEERAERAERWLAEVVAERDQAIRERDAAQSDYLAWWRQAHDAATQVRTLSERSDLLREALTKYGVHLWPCRMVPHPDHPMHRWEVKEGCTCGLDAVLGEKNDGT